MRTIIAKALFAFVGLFIIFRLIIPYMISSQSTELCIIAGFIVIIIIGIVLSKMEIVLTKFFKNNKDGEE